MEEDRVVIFTTEKAFQANWLDNGHIDQKTGTPKKRNGLEQCIAALGLKCEVVNTSIPDGRNEMEIWKLFRIFEKQIPSDSEVYVDITHSFRSLPMLAMVALNYAKITKKISIGYRHTPQCRGDGIL
jgi:CRISPR-associated DxTHG motif protein